MTSIRPNTFSVPQPRDHMVEKFGGNEKASGLPCPMLSTLVNEDLLVPNENGEVTLDQIKQALSAVGISRMGQALLAHGGAKATESLERGVIELLSLQGSNLDHKGSLGPLQDGGFNEGFLDQLKSFSSDGKTLTLDDLAAAQATRLEGDGASVRGKLLGYAEISALFLVLGRPNQDGVKAITLTDVDRIFRDNKLPEGFEPESVNLVAVAWNALKLAWKQNLGAAGARAEKGLRDALEEPAPIDTTSMMGLGAMCPAGMRPKQGDGATPGDVQRLHQNLQNAQGLQPAT